MYNKKFKKNINFRAKSLYVTNSGRTEEWLIYTFDEGTTKIVNINGEKHIEADNFNNTILISVMHFMLILSHVLSHSDK